MNLIRSNNKAMAKQNKNRYYPVHQFYSDLDKMLKQLWNDFDLPGLFDQKKTQGFSPAVNVSEDEKNIHVSVELPGMTQEDIRVSVSGEVLSIEGEKKEQKKENPQNIYQLERRFGQFQRSIRLPSEIEEGGVDATFKDGVLDIRLPKTAKSQARMIDVKAS